MALFTVLEKGKNNIPQGHKRTLYSHFLYILGELSMKLTTLTLLLMLAISPTRGWSQTSGDYLSVTYSSICCLAPSAKPVIDFIERFETQNHLQPLDIIHIGYGPEGEYTLYIGITHLTDEQINHLWSGLRQIASHQNQQRNENRDGIVSVGERYKRISFRNR